MRLPLPHRSVLSALLALAWPLQGLAAVPPGTAAEIVSLEGLGDQRGASTSDWRPARLTSSDDQDDYGLEQVERLLKERVRK